MANYIQGFESQDGEALPRIRLNPNRMFDIMQAGTAAHLAILINILITGHIIKRFLIVRCPSGEGIPFQSYHEIPEVVRDPGMDIDVAVSAEIVEPTYRLVLD